MPEPTRRLAPLRRCSTRRISGSSIAFFLVAIDFIVFDLEAAFL